MEKKPLYAHGCDNCIFLGSFERKDLYYCPQGDVPTLIARHSDECDDYTSGMHLVGVNPLIAEAHKRAVRRGLIYKWKGERGWMSGLMLHRNNMLTFEQAFKIAERRTKAANAGLNIYRQPKPKLP